MVPFRAIGLTNEVLGDIFSTHKFTHCHDSSRLHRLFLDPTQERFRILIEIARDTVIMSGLNTILM
jgi:hypothetical protein